MVDVTAANSKSMKNRAEKKSPNGKAASIFGNVMNTRAAPEFMGMSNANTAENTVIPANRETSVSNTGTGHIPLNMSSSFLI